MPWQGCDPWRSQSPYLVAAAATDRSTVDLQCLSISAEQQSDSVLHTHTYIYLILFHYGLLWWELQATFKYTIVLLTLVTMVYVTSPSLFYNWKFAPFEPIYPFLLPHPSSYPPSFWQPPMDSLYEIFVCLFVRYTCKCDHTVFVFPCLPYFI